MDETRELLRLTKEGDEDAREKIVINNMGLIWSVVKRFTNRGYDPEDLFQIGSIGLLKAVDKFDLSYDVKFSTYAVPMIIGEIRRFLRDDGMLKVSRTLKENGAKISRETQKWREMHSCEPTLQDLADQTGISPEDILLAVSANAPVDSLYRTVPGSSGKEITLQEQIRDEKNEIENEINHLFLEQLLSVLEKDERRLIFLRYFQGKTQSEVAGILNVTQVQVSRMEKKLLAKMRESAEREK